MEPRKKVPQPPAGVSAEAKALWTSILAEFRFGEGVDKTLLGQMVLAFDRLREVQRTLKTDGLMVPAPGGLTKVHPLIAVESQLRRDILAFCRALRINQPEI